MIENFFTTEQVANILQVHPFTILKFIKEGKLQGIKLGRVYRIKESDVQIFLDGRSTQPRKSTKNETPQVEVQTPQAKTAQIPQTSDPTPYQIKPAGEGGESPHYYVI